MRWNRVCFTGSVTSDTSSINYGWYDFNNNLVSTDSVLCLTANADNGGTYTFYAENGCGYMSCTSTLTVDLPPTVSCSGDQQVCDSSGVCFTASILSGVNPIEYEWVDANNNLLSSDSSLCLTATDSTAGTYYFEAFNICGLTYCSSNLTITQPPVVTCSGNQEVCAGTEVCFSGTLVSGTGPIDYLWFDSNNTLISTDSVLCFTASADSAGTYTLLALNGCGFSTCSSTLTVDEPPQVSCSGDQEVCDGTPVCFYGSILSGLEPITYEWLDSNNNIVSFDSTLCLTASSGNAGAYTFYVENACGSTSCTSTLTVETKYLLLVVQVALKFVQGQKHVSQEQLNQGQLHYIMDGMM